MGDGTTRWAECSANCLPAAAARARTAAELPRPQKQTVSFAAVSVQVLAQEGAVSSKLHRSNDQPWLKPFQRLITWPDLGLQLSSCSGVWPRPLWALQLDAGRYNPQSHCRLRPSASAECHAGVCPIILTKRSNSFSLSSFVNMSLGFSLPSIFLSFSAL